MNKMDTTQYLDVFIDESTEHLDVLYKQLLELEKNPSDKEVIEEIFRAAHTLKGMSATMGYEDVTHLTHKLENVFDGIRNNVITINAEIVDVLFEAADHLNDMIADISSGGEGLGNIQNIEGLLNRIENGESPVSDDIAEDAIQEKIIAEWQSIKHLDEFELSILNESEEQGFMNYEITVHLSEACLLKGARAFMVFEVLDQLGEVIKSEPPVHDLEEEKFDSSFTVMFVSKHEKQEIKEKIKQVSEIDDVVVHPFSLEQYKKAAETKKENSSPDKTVNDVAQGKDESASQARITSGLTKTIRVNIDRLDDLMNLFEELVIDRGRLEQLAMELEHQELQETVERMTRVSGDLQSVILNMRMVPVEQVFSRFPSMVRSISRDLHKKVEIEIIGADTELDRTMIDELGDPLIHLLRNAIDHGLETPDVRNAAGKPEQGLIKLEAYHSGNHVFIDISDDGQGIDKEAVLKKAIGNGIISETQSEALTDQEVYELILASGFSTAEAVSDISGRGVGLDVVRNTIESLGGSLSINSNKGVGTSFSIQLPLTLSIISILLVEVGQEKYAVPLSSIIETAIIHKDEILSVRNKKVIDFRGNIIPLTSLEELFSIPQEKESDFISIVIVKKGDNLTGLVVDSFIGQQEVVLKTLGNYLSNVFAISGATILGDGQVSLIIDTNALVK